MRKFSLIIAVLFISTINFVNAQLQVLRDQGSGAPVAVDPFPDVKGSPYWKEFDLGKVIFSDRDTAENLDIAFNAFNHTLVYKDGRELMAYVPGKINGFILNASSAPQFYRSGYDIPGVGKNRFVEVLVDGDYTLVNHKFKRMIDDPGAAYGSQRAKVFSNVEDLIVFKDGESFLWKPKKKSLVGFFGSDGYSKINEFAATYNLDLKDPTDVRRVIMFLNSEK
ncbi:hypothetical protein [Mongoliibacter ruber]|uniref:Uncharacterized protein n=1 Tax=Mongoliibacter ruber TaxID=1750599 RepID=A0A2T0WBC8_9BACT|nr:hypothetical protein [Mongoliibacter ruber]PRY84019.1 hypothetical protein CLW00_12412 [Mongoliibacter ruber]